MTVTFFLFDPLYLDGRLLTWLHNPVDQLLSPVCVCALLLLNLHVKLPSFFFSFSVCFHSAALIFLYHFQLSSSVPFHKKGSHSVCSPVHTSTSVLWELELGAAEHGSQLCMSVPYKVVCSELHHSHLALPVSSNHTLPNHYPTIDG